jgi:nitrite reductase/ring-hydroxylating ferredoxin subunit
MPGVFLCRLDELPDGGSRGFDPHGEGRDTVLVVRQGGTVHAWHDACPHYGTQYRQIPLAWRKDAYLSGDGTSIVCAAHGARFDIVTGICTLGPCLGQGLQRVELLITPDNDIYIPPQGARRPT